MWFILVYVVYLSLEEEPSLPGDLERGLPVSVKGSAGSSTLDASESSATRTKSGNSRTLCFKK